MAHLSVPAGTLDVSGSDDERHVTITWSVAVQPSKPRTTSSSWQFDVKRAAAGQLAGTLNYEWSEAAAIITLVMSKARLLFDAGRRHHATSVH
ncbi:hypothetical protein B5K05_23775 [Rhizobium phaseoli]|nr:hypothetical protein B5K04_23710 [Rhizobium phaseoli]RDJ06955.1 hypothetical protein B5K05_23775 [Rhizobium phaseoli]